MSASPSKISPERLNQIALRKLTAFGLSPRLDPARQVLVCEWPFRAGKVVAPGTQVRIPSARFQVEGHDRARFLAPPLAALEPLSFYDAQSLEEFELRVARALSVRMRWLHALAGQLAERKIAVRLDGNALVLRGQVETTEHVFELEADPNGMRMVRMRGLHSQTPPVAISLPFRLEDHATRTELELFLSMAAERGDLAKTASTAGAKEVEIHAVPPAPDELTASLLQRFGPHVILRARGDRVELSQTFRVGNEECRFEAAHVSGPIFRGRLLVGGAEKWSDRFDVGRFPGVEKLVRICMNVPEPTVPVPRGVEPTPGGILPPHAGEAWVMSVLVERDRDGEVRYTCADVDGRPYGATRVLGAADFRATFSPHGAGWRLRIEIARLEGETVVYRQLDPAGEKGPEKQLPLAIFMTVFMPEAQAY